MPWLLREAWADGSERSDEQSGSEQRATGLDPQWLAPAAPPAPDLNVAPSPDLDVAPSPDLDVAPSPEAVSSASGRSLGVGRRRRLDGMVGVESGAALWEPFTQEDMPLTLVAREGSGPTLLPDAAASASATPWPQPQDSRAAPSA
eukprot:scaffold15121_cov56-Isochrysis_galbana.AAC.1